MVFLWTEMDAEWISYRLHGDACSAKLQRCCGAKVFGTQLGRRCSLITRGIEAVFQSKDLVERLNYA